MPGHHPSVYACGVSPSRFAVRVNGLGVEPKHGFKFVARVLSKRHELLLVLVEQLHLAEAGKIHRADLQRRLV